MTIQEEGRIGEKIIREYLKSLGIDDMFQADWIVYYEKDRLIEAKHQEAYKPPPFYGHGLPIWQVEARLRFYSRTRVEPYLFIVEKSDYERKKGHHLIWHQSLITLEMGKYKDTDGTKPRRVYIISSFKKTYFSNDSVT